MSFGEFLIRKGHITRKQLIQGWIEQESTTGSPAKLAFENSLVPEDRLTQILDLSARTGQSFRESCISLDLWTEELNKKLTQLGHIARLPIGQILVRQRCIPLTQMVAAFEEYLKDPDSPIAEYCALFGDNERTELTEIIDSLAIRGAENSIETIGIVHQCRICFLAARNLAVGADSPLSAELYNDAAILLQTLENAVSGITRPRQTDFKRVAAAIRQVLAITQSLQRCLRENGNEKSFLEKEDNQQRHQLVMAWIHLLIQNLRQSSQKPSQRATSSIRQNDSTSDAGPGANIDAATSLDREMTMLVEATLCRTAL